MKAVHRILWACAALLAIVGAMSVVAPPAIAQMKALLVHDMDSPARGVRHTENFQAVFESGAFSETTNVVPVIPAGKKLVLQSISLHAVVTDGQSVMDARLTLSDPAIVARFSIDMDFQAEGETQRHFTGNRDLDIVLNAGEALSVFMFRTDNLGASGLNFYTGTITGYLVDADT